MIRQRQLNFLLYGQPEELFWSVGEILIRMLSFRVSTSKSKNTDHPVKETCATMSIHVTYGTNQMSLLRDSKM